MAYGLRYFSEFADELEKVYRVEIHERNYSGATLEVTSGGVPFVLEMMSVDNIFSPIREKKATLEWTAEIGSLFEIQDLFIEDDQKYILYLLSVDEEENSTKIFTGYLVTVDCEEPFQAKPYHVQLAAMCSLAFASDKYFLGDNDEFILDKVSLKDAIGQCLQSTGLNLDFHTYVDLYDIQMPSGDPLALAEIDADGLRGLTCYEVLDGILTGLNAYVVQDDNVWIVKGIPDSAAILCPRRIYDYQGVFKSSAIVNQSISIYGEEIYSGTPNILPTANVTVKLADISSVVKSTIAPGIAVNRLANGQFAYPIVGGNLRGWNIHLNNIIYPVNGVEAPGWQRAGSGRLNDAYRFEMRGYGLLWEDGKKKDTPSGSSVDTHIDINDPIIIDAGLFGVSVKIKLVVSGAFRARDVNKLYIECRLNDGDRDYVSWLDESGKWSLEKKDRVGIKVDVDTPHPDISLPVSELALQTFEITSSPLDNFLNRSGHGIVKVYFRVFPGIAYGEVTPEEVEGGVAPILALEDFAVCVTTETIYEGEHTYVIDTKLPIRNSNEVGSKSIIADKLNITTPEQVRLTNRVMTGYMTLTNTDNLTYAWKRRIGGLPDPYDGIAWPIQYKVLKEKARQLSGKRVVMDGSFLGYNLKSSSTLFSGYDYEETPSKFYTITGWKWAVKKRLYDLTINELSLEPLDGEKEFIELDKEGSTGRGNRLYGGASGSSSSGSGGPSGSDPIPEIDIDVIDPFNYIVGVGDASSRVLDVAPLILSSHVPKDFVTKMVVSPDWLTEISIYRGEDLPEADIPEDGILEIHWKGKPTETGNYQIVIELSTSDGADYLLVIPIIVYPKTTQVSQIIDADTLDIIGVVPGFYRLPDSGKWEFRSKIKGAHDKAVVHISGGGASGSEVNYTETYQGELTDEANYLTFEDIGGVLTEAGVFDYEVTVFRGEEQTSKETGFFTLYDDEYLTKASFELWDTAKDELLGVIDPSGISVFKKPESFNVKVILTGLENDKTSFTLTLDGVQDYTRDFEQTTVEDITYDLFEDVTPARSGKYELQMDNFLLPNQVYQRKIAWAIQEEPPKPEAGIDLITFGQNVVNYTLVDSLPLTNYEIDLPDNWGASIPVPAGVDYGWAGYQLFDSTSGALVNFDIALRTGIPQSRTYLEGQEKEDILIFGLQNSTDFAGIHRAPSSFRIVATFRETDASSEIVAIRQADFAFRIPLEPGDYSGARFVTFDSGGDVSVIDANMPKSGRKYILPETGLQYSVSVRSFNGLLFDEVIVQYKKLISGDYVNLHLFDTDSVKTYTGAETNELDEDTMANIVGFVNSDGLRYLFGPGGDQVIIDEIGSYEAVFTFKNAGVEVGITTVDFEIIDGTPEDLPITDCCGSGEELVIIPGVSGTYGNESTVPSITIDEYGRVTSAESIPISIDWDQISTHPTTISGYGITDAYTKVEIDEMLIGSISGTVNRIPMFVTSHILGDSPMQVSGGRVTTLAIHEAKSFESTEAASATIVTGYSWMNGTLPRWQLGKVGAETGANLGSDLYLSRFNDAGAFDGNVFSISRQTSIVSFNYVVAGQTPTASNHLATKGYIDTALLGYVPKTRTIKINDITHDLSTDVVFSIASSVAGTIGRLLKFTSSSTAGDSLATESSGRITVAGISEASNFESNQAASDTIVGGYSWKNGATIHWQLGKIGAHSGGNTGSNLILARFNDAGSYDGNIFEISRQTAILNFNYVVSGQTPTAPSHLTTKGYTDTGDIPGGTAFGWGNHALAGYGLSTAISGTAGKIMKFGTSNTAVNSIMTETAGRIDVAGLLAATAFISNAAPDPSNPTGFTFANGSSIRWTFGKYGSETGGNAGSNLLLSKYSDAGGFNGDVFSISRATGITTFSYVVRGPGPAGNDDYTPKYYVDNAAYPGQVAYGWGNHASAGYALASALSGYSLVGHTHVAANITDFTAAARLTISGSGIDYNNSTGVIHLTNSNVIDAIGYFPYNSSNPAGYISGINSSMVAGALGYTPYNATNPAGYITSAALTGYATESYVNSRGFITGITSSNIVDALGYFPYNASNPSGYISSINSGMIISALGYTPEQNNRTITIVFNGTTYTQNVKDNPNFTLSTTGGTITGSGTTNYLAKWSSGNSITNCRIFDSGSGEILMSASVHVDSLDSSGSIQMGSGISYGTFSALNLYATSRFYLPTGTEAAMNALSSPQSGELFFVNTGTGFGLWSYFSGYGWRIMATRLWVGASGVGSSPP